MRAAPFLPFAFVLAASPLAAATLHVPGGYPTVGAALAVAVSGDTVRVHPGRYAEHGLVVRGGVALLGEPAATEETSLDGELAGTPILSTSSGAPVTIRWLTFRAGSGTSSGAISSSTGAHVVSDCIFLENNPRAINASGMQIRRCTFVGNEGASGSAVYGSNLHLESCVFRSNHATTEGGALRISSGEVSDCHFEGNTCDGNGGAVFNLTAAIRDCRFVSNAATSSTSVGGGLRCAGLAEISGCVFVGNQAGRDGGGLWISGTSTAVRGCRFLENEAQRGGGLFTSVSNTTVEQCSFRHDRADSGGAIYGPTSSTRSLTVRRTVIQESRAGRAIAGARNTTPTVESCDFFENVGGDFTEGMADVTMVLGNFSANALFCETPRESLFVVGASPLLAANNDAGVDIGAAGMGCPTQGVVLESRPVGVPVTVDGVNVVLPAVFKWAPGSSHTVSAPLHAVPAGGVRTDFESWSDGGAASHTIIAPDTPATLRATFLLLFVLDMTRDDCGTYQPFGGWKPAFIPIEIVEIGNPGCIPRGWEGSGPGSYTGSSPEAVLPMIGPVSQHALFDNVGYYTLTVTAQPGGSATPEGGQFVGGTVIPLEAIPDPGYIFTSWTGQGNGSYTGTNPTPQITMNGPISEEAGFRYHGGTVHVEMHVVGDGTAAPPTGEYTILTPLHLSAVPGEGSTFDRWVGEGQGSYTGPEPQATAFLFGPITETAHFAVGGVYPLTMTATPGGVVTPTSGDRTAGSTFDILATPFSGFRFMEWQGEGTDAYSGPEARASITMHSAIMEHAIFEADTSLEHGYEFSLSASDSDPFVNFSPAPGGIRAVHLWLTCSQLGISAMECGVQSTLPIYGFTPGRDVVNFGNGDELLLAIADCPTGEPTSLLLGTWAVLDTGGQICLGPSASNDVFAAVDCGIFPAMWEDPLARGFSSVNPKPCVTGTNGCGGPAPLRPGPLADVAMPTGFRGVSPSPFRSSTEIRFSMAARGHARIALYDVMGRLVETIRDAEFPAGEHRVQWNGRAGGRIVGPGIYFVRFEAGTVRRTERVVFLGASR